MTTGSDYTRIFEGADEGVARGPVRAAARAREDANRKPPAAHSLKTARHRAH